MSRPCTLHPEPRQHALRSFLGILNSVFVQPVIGAEREVFYRRALPAAHTPAEPRRQPQPAALAPVPTAPHEPDMPLLPAQGARCRDVLCGALVPCPGAPASVPHRTLPDVVEASCCWPAQPGAGSHHAPVLQATIEAMYLVAQSVLFVCITCAPLLPLRLAMHLGFIQGSGCQMWGACRAPCAVT